MAKFPTPPPPPPRTAIGTPFYGQFVLKKCTFHSRAQFVPSHLKCGTLHLAQWKCLAEVADTTYERPPRPFTRRDLWRTFAYGRVYTAPTPAVEGLIIPCSVIDAFSGLEKPNGLYRTFRRAELSHELFGEPNFRIRLCLHCICNQHRPDRACSYQILQCMVRFRYRYSIAEWISRTAELLNFAY